MAHDLDKLKLYLIKLGTNEVAHPSNSDFLSHLIGVYHWLAQWGCPEQVMLAGLFHSVYGTQAFQEFALPVSRREEIQVLIGESAERLVYAYCAMTYQSLGESLRGSGAPRLWDRFEDYRLDMTEQEFTQLLWVKLADIMEQDARSIGRIKREETVGIKYGWRKVAEHLHGRAIESWDEVYGGQQ